MAMVGVSAYCQVPVPGTSVQVTTAGRDEQPPLMADPLDEPER